MLPKSPFEGLAATKHAYVQVRTGGHAGVGAGHGAEGVALEHHRQRHHRLHQRKLVANALSAVGNVACPLGKIPWIWRQRHHRLHQRNWSPMHFLQIKIRLYHYLSGLHIVTL